MQVRKQIDYNQIINGRIASESYRVCTTKCDGFLTYLSRASMPVEVSARAVSVRPFSARWKSLDAKANLVESLESPFVRWEVKSPDFAVFVSEVGGQDTVLLTVSPKVEIIKNAQSATLYTGTFSGVTADFHAYAVDFSKLVDKQIMIAWLWESIRQERAASDKAARSVSLQKKKYRARQRRREARLCTPTLT